MPTLDAHQSNEYVKLLLLGHAKSGKTTSLVSLAEAGYKLRILDLDNLLAPLTAAIRERCPDKLRNVEYRTIRDIRKMTDAGPTIQGVPKAFPTAIKMIDRWKYDDTDLGIPGNWGPECILVIDSLSRFCDAAYDWCEALIPRGKSGDFDGRAVYGNAQDAVENVLSTITGDAFETNVIVLCHGVYQEEDKGVIKIFPQGVGQKLSPKIPQYFPNYIRYKNLGGKRTIQLKSDPMIDLATPKSVQDETLPLETGLATLFEKLRGTAPAIATQPKPNLKRA